MRKAIGTIAIALSLAAAGCTTNNNPGNGQPSNTPSVSPSSTPGASSGSTSTQAPMASSLTAPNTPSERAAASVDAIAVLSADQAYQGRVLGVANPAPKGSTTTTAPVKSALKPAAPSQAVETVAPEGSTASSGTPIRLATDAGGNVVMTNGSAPAATTTASPSRIKRFWNYIKGNPQP